MAMSRLIKIGILLVIFFSLTMTGQHYFRKTSEGYNFFFSPSDLYINLAEASFDLSTPGTTRELEFTTKYPGNHWLSVLVENPVVPAESYDSDFKVKITIRSAGSIVSETFSRDASFLFYGGKNRSGFALKTYTIPDDLPIRHPLKAKITVIKESPAFTEKYAKHRLIISKFSDE